MLSMKMTLGSDDYELAPVVEALRFGHDCAMAEDVRNACKNMAEPKLSPLTLKFEEALGLLQEIIDRHGTPAVVEGTVTDDPADPDSE